MDTVMPTVTAMDIMDVMANMAKAAVVIMAMMRMAMIRRKSTDTITAARIAARNNS